MLSEELINQCREKLLKKKTDLLNQRQLVRHNMEGFSEGRGGDEGDQAVRLREEQNFMDRVRRVQFQLEEVEKALARIENNSYGICEATGEPIEQKRLLKMPWTALSIAGAEEREDMQKKYAR